MVSVTVEAVVVVVALVEASVGRQAAEEEVLAVPAALVYGCGVGQLPESLLLERPQRHGEEGRCLCYEVLPKGGGGG